MKRKRHVVVDTAGLPLGVLITAANVSDQAGARELLKEVCLRFGWLRHIWADAGYLGQKLLAAVQQLIPNRGLRIQIVKRSDLHRHSFEILPHQLVLERPFAWLSFSPPLPKTTKSRPITVGLSSSSPLLESCSNVSLANFWTVSKEITNAAWRTSLCVLSSPLICSSGCSASSNIPSSRYPRKAGAGTCLCQLIF